MFKFFTIGFSLFVSTFIKCKAVALILQKIMTYESKINKMLKIK